MRLNSGVWVSAYLRRCAAENVPALVARRGHDAAGAIFIMVDRLDGTVNLYGPAPAGLSGADSERRWVRCLGGDSVEEWSVSSFLNRQIEFDPDLWIISVEDKQGRHFLGEALIAA